MRVGPSIGDAEPILLHPLGDTQVGPAATVPGRVAIVHVHKVRALDEGVREVFVLRIQRVIDPKRARRIRQGTVHADVAEECGGNGGAPSRYGLESGHEAELIATDFLLDQHCWAMATTAPAEGGECGALPGSPGTVGDALERGLTVGDAWSSQPSAATMAKASANAAIR